MKARGWPKWSPTIWATACSCIHPITPTPNPAFRSPPTKYSRGSLWGRRSCEKCSGTTPRDASESRSSRMGYVQDVQDVQPLRSVQAVGIRPRTIRGFLPADRTVSQSTKPRCCHLEQSERSCIFRHIQNKIFSASRRNDNCETVWTRGDDFPGEF